jgi:hypothetical protein
VEGVCAATGLNKPLVSIPALLFVVPLQLAWWLRILTRWTPPVSVESMMNSSVYDGTDTASELGFIYTPLNEIFG